MNRKTYPTDLSDAEWLILEPLIPAVKREDMNDALRESEGRKSEPTAAIVDSQSVKTTAVKGERGFDGNKKINGRKRHIMVDVLGLLLAVVVHKASVQERAEQNCSYNEPLPKDLRSWL